MRYWYEALPALKEAMAEHFPNADDYEIERWADSIYNASSSAASLERVERGDTLPGDDIKNIRGTANNLRLAAKKLGSVGWHGNKWLLNFAKEVRKMNDALPGDPLLDTMDSSVYLANFLRAFADRLDECEIAPEGESAMAMFDENSARQTGKGRGRKTEAYFTAREAWNAFEALTKKRPTVATWYSGGIYGRLFDFVSSVFDCLAVDASAETWVRYIDKEKKRAES